MVRVREFKLRHKGILHITKVQITYSNISRIREDALLEVNNQRLLNHLGSSILERLMRRIFLHIIISILIRIESEDKSVAHAILRRMSEA